ncbi:MAG: hypothetical protein C0485_19150 [Pirellula sp.]|nr:hypothetical protein [Pirellula sp.]
MAFLAVAFQAFQLPPDDFRRPGAELARSSTEPPVNTSNRNRWPNLGFDPPSPGKFAPAMRILPAG